jgi:hypothetical protein
VSSNHSTVSPFLSFRLIISRTSHLPLSVVALAKLYHSVVKMGIDAQAAFGNAASFADAGLIKTELKHFASRGPKDRDISAFYWTEEGDGENFRYKQVLPGSLRR